MAREPGTSSVRYASTTITSCCSRSASASADTYSSTDARRTRKSGDAAHAVHAGDCKGVQVRVRRASGSEARVSRERRRRETCRGAGSLDVRGGIVLLLWLRLMRL